MNTEMDNVATGYAGKCARMMEAVLGTVHESLVVLDHGLCVVAVNRGFTRTTGIEAAEAVGRDFDEAIASRWTLPGLVESLRDVVTDGETITDLELTHRARATDFRTLRISASRVTPPGGEVPMVLLSIEDVTVGRRLERMREDLLATVSHDLRTPLSALQGFARVLMEQPELSNDKKQEYLRIIHDEAQYLNLLVERFVDNVG